MTRKDDPADEAAIAWSLAGRLRALDFADTDPPRGLRELEGALERFAGARADGKAERIAAWSAIADSVAALATALESEQRGRSVDRLRLAEGLRWVAQGTAETERLTARVGELEPELAARQADLRAAEARITSLEAEARVRDAAIAAASAEAQRLAAELEAARESGRTSATRIAELEGEQQRLTAEGAAERAGFAAEKARLDAETARLTAQVQGLEAIAAQPGHRFVTRMGAIVDAHPRIAKALSAIVRGLNRLVDRPGR